MVAKKKTSKLQTVLVSKKLPLVKAEGLKGAKKIADDMSVKHTKVDETANFFRFRQHDPKGFVSGSFRTFSPRKGIEFVYGKIKKGK